jgi:hypothetical protein
MPTPEKRIKDIVKRRLADEFNTLMYRFAPVQNGMGSPTLDVLYCVDGLWFWIETKAPGKEPTPRQDLTIAAIRAAGGICYVVDSAELVEMVIKDIRKKIRARDRLA